MSPLSARSAARVALFSGAVMVALAGASARAQGAFLEEIEGDDADLDDDLDEPTRADDKPAKPDVTPRAEQGKPPAPAEEERTTTTRGPAGGAPAKDPRDPKQAEGAEGAEGAEAADAKVPLSIVDVEVAQLTWAGLLERWDARRAVRKSRDAAAMSRGDSLLEEGLRSYGVQGAPGGLNAVAFASALVEESSQEHAGGDPQGALELAAFAIRIAPDLPRAHAHQAELKIDGGDYGGAIASLLAWGRALAHEPTSRVLVVMGALTIALLSLVATLFLSSLLFLARSFRFLSFDLHNALPRGAARWQLQLLVVLVAALPVVTATGPVVAALWWLTLAWVYLSKREQIVVGVLGGLLVLAPLAVDTLSVLWSYPGSRVARAYDASHDAGALDAVKSIEALPPSSRSLRERAVLASLLKREGRIDEAYVAWREIVQELPHAAWAHNNLGVVAALAGKEEHAIAELDAAVERDPSLVEASFNLAQIHQRHGRLEKASALLVPLETRAPSRVELFRTQTFRRADQKVDQNRAFVDAAMPPTPLGDLYLTRSPDAAALEREVAGVAFFGLSPGYAAGMLGAFLVVWLLLARLKGRLLPSQPCVRCGSAASRRYDAAEVPVGTCSACFHAFLNPHARIEAGMKLRKERQVAAYKRRYATTLRLLTALFPGAGHLFGGGAITGALLSLFFSIALSSALLAFGPMPWPSLSAETPRYVAAFFIGAALLVAYAAGLSSVGRLAAKGGTWR